MHKWLMSIMLATACLVGCLTLISGCTKDNQQSQQQEKPPVTSEFPDVTLDAAAADSVARQSCIACHGGNLEGAMGPALDHIGAKMSREELYAIIHDGKGGMPAFADRLSEEEIANLSLWLAEKK